MFLYFAQVCYRTTAHKINYYATLLYISGQKSLRSDYKNLSQEKVWDPFGAPFKDGYLKKDPELFHFRILGSFKFSEAIQRALMKT